MLHRIYLLILGICSQTWGFYSINRNTWANILGDHSLEDFNSDMQVLGERNKRGKEQSWWHSNLLEWPSGLGCYAKVMMTNYWIYKLIKIHIEPSRKLLYLRYPQVIYYFPLIPSPGTQKQVEFTNQCLEKYQVIKNKANLEFWTNLS